MEVEDENKLPYLDMVIVRADGRLKTKWYTKPSPSNRIIGYTSCHTSRQKIMTASNMIERAYKLTDTEQPNTSNKKIKSEDKEQC